jgi:hypothetical protein
LSVCLSIISTHTAPAIPEIVIFFIVSIQVVDVDGRVSIEFLLITIIIILTEAFLGVASRPPTRGLVIVAVL